MGRDIGFGLNCQMLKKLLVTCLEFMEDSASQEEFFTCSLVYYQFIQQMFIEYPLEMLGIILGPRDPTVNKKSYGADILRVK